MAVEFVAKSTIRLEAVKGRWIITWPLVLLFLAGGAYAGLAYYESTLNAQLTKVEEDIQAVDVGRDITAEDKVLILERQLATLEDVIKNHVYFSKFLTGLEGLTHPEVHLRSFSINVPTKKFDISGQAASFTVLAKQIITFTKSQDIEKVEIGGLSLSAEGNLGFTMGITYKPSFVQK